MLLFCIQIVSFTLTKGWLFDDNSIKKKEEERNKFQVCGFLMKSIRKSPANFGPGAMRRYKKVKDVKEGSKKLSPY